MPKNFLTSVYGLVLEVASKASSEILDQNPFAWQLGQSVATLSCILAGCMPSRTSRWSIVVEGWHPVTIHKALLV